MKLILLNSAPFNTPISTIKTFKLEKKNSKFSKAVAFYHSAVGMGRFNPEMGLGGENQHFLFYTPCVKNASFSRYSIVLFSHIPVQELSRLAKRVFALRAHLASLGFARN